MLLLNVDAAGLRSLFGRLADGHLQHAIVVARIDLVRINIARQPNAALKLHNEVLKASESFFYLAVRTLTDFPTALAVFAGTTTLTGNDQRVALDTHVNILLVNARQFSLNDNLAVFIRHIDGRQNVHGRRRREGHLHAAKIAQAARQTERILHTAHHVFHTIRPVVAIASSKAGKCHFGKQKVCRQKPAL
jgi:hypothetical protein